MSVFTKELSTSSLTLLPLVVLVQLHALESSATSKKLVAELSAVLLGSAIHLLVGFLSFVCEDVIRSA